MTDAQIVEHAVAHMGRLIDDGRTPEDIARLVEIELVDLHQSRAAA